MRHYIPLVTCLCFLNFLPIASASVKIIVYDVDGITKVPNINFTIAILGRDRCYILTDKTDAKGEYDVEKNESLFNRCRRITQQKGKDSTCHKLRVTVDTENKQGVGFLDLVNDQWQPQPLKITLQNSKYVMMNPNKQWYEFGKVCYCCKSIYYCNPCFNPCNPCFNPCN